MTETPTPESPTTEPTSGEGASQAAPPPAEPRSWFAGKLWFWVPIPPLVALDLWSKSAVFGFLAETYPDEHPLRREHPIVESPFGFSFVQWTNKGTIWGLGKDYNLALIALRFVAMGLLIWFAATTRTADRVKQLVLALVMAGAVGNLYDNVFAEDRAVRDFLKFFWPHDDGTESVFPAFNVADSCICVGAIGLAILIWREDRRASASA